jgi:hypothetical protein
MDPVSSPPVSRPQVDEDYGVLRDFYHTPEGFFHENPFGRREVTYEDGIL